MMKWNFENGKYTANGFEVFSTGFEWKVKRISDGFVFARCMATIETAEKYAESMMNETSRERNGNKMTRADMFTNEMITIENQAKDLESQKRLTEKMLKKHHGRTETRPCEKSVLNLNGIQKRYVFDDGSSTEWLW